MPSQGTASTQRSSLPLAAGLAPTPATRGRRQRPRGWARLLALVRSQPIGALGAMVVAIVVLMAALAPVIAPYEPTEQTTRRLTAPNAQYLLGADEFGRDVLSRLVYGARISLYVGMVSVAIALVVGGVLGLVAGYYRGWPDALLMRLVDIMLAFPGIILAIVMVGMLGPGLNSSLVALGVVYAPTFARLARASTMVVSREEYATAARALGAGDRRILGRHIAPNILAPLITQASLAFSTAILAEAALSFLGLGTQPPEPSWGLMLGSGRKFMEVAPWLAVYPGLAIMLAVLGFNLLGDGLRDVLDPRARVR
ncbi:MAG: ABC transporter permease [Chloroflexi bacterium]|nr:ABC transporter permease [Chloroflexota bacterium]